MRQGIKKKITALTITSAMAAATLGGSNFAFAAKNQPQNEGQRPTVATGSSIGVIGEKPNKKPVTPGAIDAKPDKKPVTPGAIDAKPDKKPAIPGEIDTKPDKKPVTPGAIDAKPDKKPAIPGEIDTKPDKKPVTPGAIDAKPDKKPVTPGAIDAKPDKKPVTPGEIDTKPDKKPVTPGAIDAKPDKKNDENKPSEGNNDIKEPVTPGAVTAKPEPANTAKRKVPKKVKVKKARKTAKNKIQITLDGTNVWSKPSVTVKTATGKSVKTIIVKKGKNSCVLKTKKQLSKGTYTIKIKGVKVKGETKYETITTKVKVK